MVQSEWFDIYHGLGYESEFNMLHDLYVEQGMSLNEIAGLLKRSVQTIRIHLDASGIKRRPRGGPNRLGMSRLAKIPDEDLKRPTLAAVKYDVHPSAIYKEKRKRREAKRGDQSGADTPISGAGVDLHKDSQDPE